MTTQYGCMISGAVAVLGIRHTVHLIGSSVHSLRSQAPGVPIEVTGHVEWKALVLHVAWLRKRDAKNPSSSS